MTRHLSGGISPQLDSRTTAAGYARCWELANPSLDDFLDRDALPRCCGRDPAK